MIQYIIILQYAIFVKYFFDFFEKNFLCTKKADSRPHFGTVIRFIFIGNPCILWLSFAAPVFSVKTSELHRLGNMGLVYYLRAVHVRYSPRHL